MKTKESAYVWVAVTRTTAMKEKMQAPIISEFRVLPNFIFPTTPLRNRGNKPPGQLDRPRSTLSRTSINLVPTQHRPYLGPTSTSSRIGINLVPVRQQPRLVPAAFLDAYRLSSFSAACPDSGIQRLSTGSVSGRDHESCPAAPLSMGRHRKRVPDRKRGLPFL